MISAPTCNCTWPCQVAGAMRDWSAIRISEWGIKVRSHFGRRDQIAIRISEWGPGSFRNANRNSSPPSEIRIAIWSLLPKCESQFEFSFRNAIALLSLIPKYVSQFDPSFRNANRNLSPPSEIRIAIWSLLPKCDRTFIPHSEIRYRSMLLFAIYTFRKEGSSNCDTYFGRRDQIAIRISEWGLELRFGFRKEG